MNTPSIGRIVHYAAHGTPIREDGTQAFPPACRAAIITELTNNPTTITLAVINPTGLFFHTATQGTEGGTWHWPERH